MAKMELSDKVKILLQEAICGICQKMLTYSGYLQIKVQMIVFADDQELLALDFKESLGDSNCVPNEKTMTDSQPFNKECITGQKDDKPQKSEPIKSESSVQSTPNCCNTLSLETSNVKTIDTNKGHCGKNLEKDGKKNQKSLLHCGAKHRSSTRSLLQRSPKGCAIFRHKKLLLKTRRNKSVFNKVLAKCRGCSWKLKKNHKSLTGEHRKTIATKHSKNTVENNSSQIHTASTQKDTEIEVVLKNKSTENPGFTQEYSEEIAQHNKHNTISSESAEIAKGEEASSEGDKVIGQPIPTKNPSLSLKDKPLNREQEKNIKIKESTKTQSRGISRCELLKKNRRQTDSRKRFHCTSCDSSFTLRTNLTSHVRRFHGDNDVLMECAYSALERQILKDRFQLPTTDEVVQGSREASDRYSSADTHSTYGHQVKETGNGINLKKKDLDLIEVSPIVITPQTNGLNSAFSGLTSSYQIMTGTELMKPHNSGNTTAINSNFLQASPYPGGIPFDSQVRSQDAFQYTVDRNLSMSQQHDSLNSQNSSTSQTIDVVNVSNETSSNCDNSGSFVGQTKIQNSGDINGGGVSVHYGVAEKDISGINDDIACSEDNGINRGKLAEDIGDGKAANKFEEIPAGNNVLIKIDEIKYGIGSTGDWKNTVGDNMGSVVKTTDDYPSTTRTREHLNNVQETKEVSTVSEKNLNAATIERKDKESAVPSTIPSATSTREHEAFPVLGLYDMVSPSKNSIDSRFIHPLTFSPVRSPLLSLATSPISSSTPFYRTSNSQGDRKQEVRRLYEDVPSPTFTAANSTNPIPAPLLNIPSYLPQSPGFLSSGFDFRPDVSTNPSSVMTASESVFPSSKRKKEEDQDEFIDVSKLTTNVAKKRLLETKSKKSHGSPKVPSQQNSSQRCPKGHNPQKGNIAHKGPSKSPRKMISEKGGEGNGNEVLTGDSSHEVSQLGGRVTTNKYRFACNLCTAKFTFRTNLTRHLKKQHRVTPGDSEVI